MGQQDGRGHACYSQPAHRARQGATPAHARAKERCLPGALRRRAVHDGRSPDLAAALQGVTHVKLFLAGEAVRPGLEVQELDEFAAAEGVSLVLPSGQALGLAGKPAPAVPL